MFAYDYVYVHIVVHVRVYVGAGPSGGGGGGGGGARARCAPPPPPLPPPPGSATGNLVQLHRNLFPPRCVMILHMSTKQNYPTDTPACIWIAFRRTSQTTTSPPPPSPSHLKVLIFVNFVHPYWHCRVGVLAYSCAVRSCTTYVCA